ncbi:hypothetical protein Tco_0974954 [Tanacetum coccineum]|uniref:Uncharacterized protein n=1 Tax=Tanacetum coccineum TaxID=301880 RepID=A0ABQ5ED84_9ASTR
MKFMKKITKPRAYSNNIGNTYSTSALDLDRVCRRLEDHGRILFTKNTKYQEIERIVDVHIDGFQVPRATRGLKIEAREDHAYEGTHVVLKVINSVKRGMTA